MNIAIVIVFLLTYVLIAARRVPLIPIGRPAGALLGAILMIVVGAMSPKDAYGAIDHDTLVLLFGMMVLSHYLGKAGFFTRVTSWVLGKSLSPFAMLLSLSVFSAILSAILVNDTICVFMTPMVVALCRRGKLPMGPYLIALATSANIGSAATLVGNPQNMIIGSMSRLGFGRFLLFSGPAAVVGLAVNALLLWAYFGRSLPASVVDNEPSETTVDRSRLVLCAMVIAGVVAGFFAGFHLGFTTLAGAMVLVLADRKEPREAVASVDWSLLVFFSSLFVVVSALGRTGYVTSAWQMLSRFVHFDSLSGVFAFSGLITVGSNLVSNVPLVLLAGPFVEKMPNSTTGWACLAFASTIAGNLTLVGSVANLIVAEGAKDHYTLGFVEYLKFGLVSTLLVIAVGIPVIWGMISLLG